jgi:predicted nucleotidyltransferase
MPAIYETISKPTDAAQGNIVTRIMIYDGIFRGLLQPGDRVDVTGVLQRVEPASGINDSDKGAFYQIMVGTKNGQGKELISATGLGRSI